MRRTLCGLSAGPAPLSPPGDPPDAAVAGLALLCRTENAAGGVTGSVAVWEKWSCRRGAVELSKAAMGGLEAVFSS